MQINVVFQFLKKILHTVHQKKNQDELIHEENQCAMTLAEECQELHSHFLMDMDHNS